MEEPRKCPDCGTPMEYNNYCDCHEDDYYDYWEDDEPDYADFDCMFAATQIDYYRTRCELAEKVIKEMKGKNNPLFFTPESQDLYLAYKKWQDFINQK